MSNHIETGKTGEDLAVAWLMQQGFEILHRNWRYSYYEIDIIAKKENYLHFIEVKCRQLSSSILPEESVSKKKFRHLKKAADIFLSKHPGFPWIQYDILSIRLAKNGNHEYFLIQDVFL